MINQVESLKRKNFMSWDTYFMSIAVLSSFRSKDKKSQVGACIVGQDNKIIGMGYNGLPRGLDDNNPKYWSDEDDNPEYSKHTYVVHAEKNAIYNSTNRELKNSTLYVTLFPCSVCAQAIIQVGIRKIVYLGKKEVKDCHHLNNKCVENMLTEAGIEIERYDELNINDNEFIIKLMQLNNDFYPN